MKYYEMLCVLPGTMTEEEIKSSAETISQIIVKNSAEDITVEDMGKSRLAYPVNHIRYGYFQLFKFNLEENNVNNLEKDVRLLDKMLRINITICDPNNTVNYKLALDPTAPSAPPKPEREERGRPKYNDRDNKVKHEETKVKSTEESVVATPEKEKVVTKIEEPKEMTETPKVAKKTTISVEDIDKKLDEILQDDIDKV